MRTEIIVLASYLNVARPVCDHLFGARHTVHHRCTVGILIMSVGVTVAKLAGHSEFLVLSYLGDGIGYAIHGLGLTPFIDAIASKLKKD